MDIFLKNVNNFNLVIYTNKESYSIIEPYKNDKNIIYNILGKNKKSLWDLFFEMASNRNKKTFKIDLILLNRFMPSIIKNILKKNSTFLQQLLIIDHSEFKEKKEYL